jgi:hypothetical protein
MVWSKCGRKIGRKEESGFGIQDSGFKIRDSRFKIRDSRFKIQDSGFKIQRFLVLFNLPKSALEERACDN